MMDGHLSPAAGLALFSHRAQLQNPRLLLTLHLPACLLRSSQAVFYFFMLHLIELTQPRLCGQIKVSSVQVDRGVIWGLNLMQSPPAQPPSAPSPSGSAGQDAVRGPGG